MMDDNGIFFATLITFKSQQADDVAGNFEEEF